MTVSFDKWQNKVLVHSELVPEVPTVSKEMYIKSPLTSGCSEKETSGKMGTKQMVSSALQCTCMLVVGGQRVSSQAKCYRFSTSTIFSGLVTIRLFPVSIILKCSDDS
jgi:hypothetical protein